VPERAHNSGSLLSAESALLEGNVNRHGEAIGDAHLPCTAYNGFEDSFDKDSMRSVVWLYVGSIYPLFQ
jgi:hypothetical protein